jgi:hypothetical protein
MLACTSERPWGRNGRTPRSSRTLTRSTIFRPSSDHSLPITPASTGSTLSPRPLPNTTTQHVSGTLSQSAIDPAIHETIKTPHLSDSDSPFSRDDSIWEEILAPWNMVDLGPFDPMMNDEASSGSGSQRKTSPVTVASSDPPPSDYDTNDLRYPVLAPLLPYMGGMLSPALVSDLMSSYTFPNGHGQYIAPWQSLEANIFRKTSLLSVEHPRQCTPALLASMLLFAASNNDALLYGLVPYTRGQLIEHLFNLTLRLLEGEDKTHMRHPMHSHDDIVAYLHLAVITAAVKGKSIGMQWFQKAVQMAKDRGLHIDPVQVDDDAPGEPDDSTTEASRGIRTHLEQLEERRRLWWTLFIWDRQLALTFNSTLLISDAECDNVASPMEDRLWQAHDLDDGSTGSLTGGEHAAARPRGVPSLCTVRIRKDESILIFYVELNFD